MVYPLKMVIFHGYVSLPEGIRKTKGLTRFPGFFPSQKLKGLVSSYPGARGSFRSYPWLVVEKQS